MNELRDKILSLRKEGLVYSQISKIVGKNKSTISYHINRFDNNGVYKPDKRVKHDWKLIAEYARNHTIREAAKKFGFGLASWTKAINTGKIKAKPKELDFSVVAVKNSTYPRKSLKRRILKEKLLDYKCKCGNTGEWQNQKLVLQLEHKNGVHNDHRLENLEFLCPNCHSQTKTFGSRNRPYKSRVV